MPTIIRLKNVRFVVYPKDHKPPHVHAIGTDNREAKIELATCRAYYVRGFSERDVSALEAFVSENRELMLEHWREYHE